MKKAKEYSIMATKFDLDGKRAVITGGAGLLGRAHAEALLSIGADVDLWDIDFDKLEEVKKEIRKKYPNSEIGIHKVDICEEEQILHAIDAASNKGNRIDILVNNAALNPTMKKDSNDTVEKSRLENYSLETWNKEITVGLTGAFLCSKHIGKAMSLNGSGVILNIASDLSVIAPDQRIYQKDGTHSDSQPVKPVSYSVIKSGLVGLTRYLATYWATSGVRANSLSPGGIFDNHSNEFVERLTSLIPMGRMASPEDYFGAIQFLCSDASSYMTGQNLIIDGGRTVW